MAQVEVDEVLRFCSDNVISTRARLPMYASQKLTMSDKAAEISPDDAMPCSTFSRIKLRDARMSGLSSRLSEY